MQQPALPQAVLPMPATSSVEAPASATVKATTMKGASASMESTTPKAASGEMVFPVVAVVAAAAADDFTIVVGAVVTVVGSVIAIIRPRIGVIFAVGRVDDSRIHRAAV